NIKIEINPPTAAITIKVPPSFGLLFTKTVPSIAKIENINADQPKPVILLLPVLLKAASTSPKIKATMAPRNPKTLPIKPNTNSVVLPNNVPPFNLLYILYKKGYPKYGIPLPFICFLHFLNFFYNVIRKFRWRNHFCFSSPAQNPALQPHAYFCFCR